MRAGYCETHGDYLGSGFCPDCFLAAPTHDAPAPDFRAVAERLAKALRERLEARNFYDRMITRRNAKVALLAFERAKEGAK